MLIPDKLCIKFQYDLKHAHCAFDPLGGLILMLKFSVAMEVGSIVERAVSYRMNDIAMEVGQYH